LLVLLPILFGELMAASLGKLHLSPGAGAAADDCDHHRRAGASRCTRSRFYGLGRFWP